MLVDSHCHLNYLEDLPERLIRARSKGVIGFLCISVNQSEYPQVRDITNANPNVWMTAGVHPQAVYQDTELEWIEAAVINDSISGIGETGLDYSRLDSKEAHERGSARQRDAFAYQLDLAGRFNLPVIVHTREAIKDTLSLMSEHRATIGVMHCFTESWESAQMALDMGYYISISGIVTFRNADQVRELAQKVPDDRLLIETDSPWLAPAPYRGKTNEPAFLSETAKCIATLRDVSYARLCKQSTDNFHRLFTSTDRI